MLGWSTFIGLHFDFEAVVVTMRPSPLSYNHFYEGRGGGLSY